MVPPVQVSAASEPELELCLLERRPGIEPGRLAGLAAASVAVNFVFAILLGGLASIEGHAPVPRVIALDTRKSTPLVFPSELTQKAPNEAKVSKEVRLDDLVTKPQVQPKQRVFTPPPAPKPSDRPSQSPLPAIEPPPVRVAQAPPPGLGTTPDIPPPPVAPPQIQSQEKPKLAFETPGSQTATSAPRPGGLTRIAPPKANIDEAVRSAARSGPGGLVIGDRPDDGGIGQQLGQTPTAPKQASQVELLSDPMGVDFKPYLVRVLAAVRRNWFAVIPESARFGRQGRVVIQFSVNRVGSVPKLVIANPSGTEAFDRAAVAGISASNPFPPLPAEFKGDQIRLQLVFFYNVASR